VSCSHSLSHILALSLSLHETRPAVAPLATHPTTAQKDGLRSMQLVDMEIMLHSRGNHIGRWTAQLSPIS
jgi:hypothetical protein